MRTTQHDELLVKWAGHLAKGLPTDLGTQVADRIKWLGLRIRNLSNRSA